ncbi:ATP-binding cassette domain-containing protein [Rhodococcus sp. Z13]|uniref:ATP-binding cassette domain-containing protein n=1 Tax=Rhodococcus sacchari TaxID=2962047 RepID=A0ACD4DG77_9NOCA|nr:ATP-binding cassette domain-containing protein [Rhodococcus sp. Z13]UYP19002.1 ATP-binding cassette domain-containing protein [Rhodococcus sp. Z13]
MSLSVRARVAARDVDVDLEVAEGSIVAVLGPNGAGKSTLLGVVSGLLRPDEGCVELDGRVLTDTATGLAVPPHDRSVVLLAQQALLFPHLTVAGNVEFAPRSAGLGRREARARAAHWLREVDATDLADRRPHELSGGQAQRVALARALAADPHLLLLDEPMSALDVTATPVLRALLRRVLREAGRTALLVTHDPLDVLALADRAVVLENGRIVEDGPARQVLTRPRSAFGARIAGTNLVTGILREDALDTADGLVHGRLDPDCAPGLPAVAVFTPSAVAVYPELPHGSPRNALRVTVAELEARGATVLVRSTTGIAAEITTAALAELDVHPGSTVWFVVKATEVGIHSTAVRSQPRTAHDEHGGETEQVDHPTGDDEER